MIGKYLGIIYYYDGIEPFKKDVLKLNKKINTYVFSLGDEVDEEEFENVRSLVTLKPIPSAILNIYKRIFAYVHTKKLPGKARELKRKIEDFLKLESNKICVFKSPTGSGKTIMMAELIKRLVNNRQDGKELSFVWITVHKLHNQSKEKLEKYYEDLQTVGCSNFNDLQDNQIQDKEILFFNWQSINQEKNIYIRENENENNLSKVIENTKDEGREIILIIDESHHTASSEKSKEVIQKINSKITIEVSATPKISDSDDVESVDLQEVKDEEMVKNSVRLNYNLSHT